MATGCDLMINFLAKAHGLSFVGWPRVGVNACVLVAPQRPDDLNVREQCRREPRQA